MPAGRNETGSNGAVATHEAGAQKKNPPHAERGCSVLTSVILIPNSTSTANPNGEDHWSRKELPGGCLAESVT